MTDEGRVGPRVIRVGCAGWLIPRDDADRFAHGESHLARDATLFAVVEIDASFDRARQPATDARWADTTPDAFGVTAAFDVTRGPLLVQVPPSRAFDPSVATAVWKERRERFNALRLLDLSHDRRVHP